LSNAGLEQFIAGDAEEYTTLAAHWAQRIDDLTKIRATMREHVRQSPLCDERRFAADLLTVLKQALQHASAI
jgi:predicted O-linked N-acetylglucosamine transferase (SPINDLY family)